MNPYESSLGNQKSEQIIQRLELKAGKKLKIVKRITSFGSRLEVGKELEGTLKNDVKIGMPIEFDNNSNTSNIKKIWEENGKYLIQTLTSTYEIINNLLEKENKKIDRITAVFLQMVFIIVSSEIFKERYTASEQVYKF